MNVRSAVLCGLIGLSFHSVQAKTWTKEEIIAHFSAQQASVTREERPTDEAQPAAAGNERTRSWNTTRSIALLNTPASAAPASTASFSVATQPRSLDMEIQFDYASAQLSQESYQGLDNLAAALNELTHAGQRFAIIGHTDGTGNEEENLRLSTLRASAVFNYLITHHHITPDQLYVQGKGETELKYPANPEHPENRRVQIVELATAR